MSSPPRIPESLRREIEKDLRPVRPLPPPLLRTLAVAVWAAVLLLVVPVVFGVRPDAPVLGPFMTWGAALVEAAGGLVLVWLALREAVPGGGIATGEVVLLLVTAVAVEAGVALLTAARSASMVQGSALAHGVECFSIESSLGLPALALTVWLTVRAFPVRPARAGLLGGAGAGLLANGVQHLICGIASLDHVMVWHLGASVFLALIGWLGGLLWETIGARTSRSR